MIVLKKMYNWHDILHYKQLGGGTSIKTPQTPNRPPSNKKSTVYKTLTNESNNHRIWTIPQL